MSHAKRKFWIYLIAFFAVWALRATLFYRIDLLIESEWLRLAYSNAVKLVVWVVPVFVYLRFVDRVDALNYLKLRTRIDRKGLAIATGVTIAYFAGVIAAESALRGTGPRAMLAATPSKMLSTLAFVLVSPLLEETMFRGFVLGKLSEWSRFRTANAVSSLLFSMAHWPYWLYSRMPLPLFARNIANVFVLGLLFGWVMRKTNSLWPATAAHVANNFLAGLMNR